MKPNAKPKRYGRQAPGRTTISASLNAEAAEWLKIQAAAAGQSVSTWVNNQLLAQMALANMPANQPSRTAGQQDSRAAG